MLFPHVVNTEADKAFVNILNTQAVSVSAGDSVIWSTTTPDGVRSTQPATATLSLFAGVADSTIAASAYGLAQAYGYRSEALVTNHTTQAVAAGDELKAVNAADHLTRSAASTGISGFVYAAAAVATATTPAAALVKVFIRAL